MVSINLSGSSLSSPSVIDFILGQFESHGVDPHNVCFEVTETAAIANFKTAIAMLTDLRERGCKVSLDDFGTGLSSFAYLRDLPIDFIKMGGGFVRDMTGDKRHEAMVQATHAVAVAMEVPMIAESVENVEIVRMLRMMGVEYMQGYGIGRPAPLDRYLVQEATAIDSSVDSNAYGFLN
jgi:EAL domain-containing protein (putative c-di-GMP-specific phosphodiesterase class I)